MSSHVNNVLWSQPLLADKWRQPHSASASATWQHKAVQSNAWTNDWRVDLKRGYSKIREALIAMQKNLCIRHLDLYSIRFYPPSPFEYPPYPLHPQCDHEFIVIHSYSILILWLLMPWKAHGIIREIWDISPPGQGGPSEWFRLQYLDACSSVLGKWARNTNSNIISNIIYTYT